MKIHSGVVFFGPGALGTVPNSYFVSCVMKMCVLCPMSGFFPCIWKKINVIMLLNSKHYRPCISLIYNKHIGIRRLSESITHWDAIHNQWTFRELCVLEKVARPGQRRAACQCGSLFVVNRNPCRGLACAGNSGGSWDLPRTSLCLLSSYTAEFSCPLRHENSMQEHLQQPNES